MKRIGIIPARYASSRLPGKPLIDLCGKPMIWWTYQNVKNAKNLDDIFVAADNELIFDVCERYHIPYIETSAEHPSHMHRLHEVSQKYPADLYICICGDEPLIEPNVIEAVLPPDQNAPLIIRGLYRKINLPTEALDPGNIKIIVDQGGQALAFSRTPIPNPYKISAFSYYKTIGVECFNRAAIEFYVNAPKGNWEAAEDIMMLRFLEHHIPALFVEVSSQSLSVDTKRDLDYVRAVIENRIIQGEHR